VERLARKSSSFRRTARMSSRTRGQGNKGCAKFGADRKRNQGDPIDRESGVRAIRAAGRQGRGRL